MGAFWRRFRYVKLAQWRSFYCDYEALARAVKTLDASVFVGLMLHQMHAVERFYQQQCQLIEVMEAKVALGGREEKV
jgi:hypothetical protein